MQFCTANGKTQKVLCRQCAQKYTVFFPCQNCACGTRAKADKQANGRLHFCEKQKTNVMEACATA